MIVFPSLFLSSLEAQTAEKYERYDETYYEYFSEEPDKIYEKTFTVKDGTVTKKVRLVELEIFDRKNDVHIYTDFDSPENNFIEATEGNKRWRRQNSEIQWEETTEDSGDEIKITKIYYDVQNNYNFYDAPKTEILIKDSKTGNTKYFSTVYSDVLTDTYVYNPETKNLIYSESFNEYYKSTEKNEYDENGKLIRKIESGISSAAAYETEEIIYEDYEKTTDYEYNEKGILIHSISSNGDEMINDDEGRLLYKKTYSDFYIYEAKGRWDEKTRTYYLTENYTPTDSLEWDSPYDGPIESWAKYDKQGRVIKSKDNQGRYTSMKYDKNGNMTYWETEDKKSTIKYDDRGNPIYTKTKFKNEDDFNEFTTEYFDNNITKWHKSVNKNGVYEQEFVMLGSEAKVKHAHFIDKDVDKERFYDYIYNEDKSILICPVYETVDDVKSNK